MTSLPSDTPSTTPPGATPPGATPPGATPPGATTPAVTTPPTERISPTPAVPPQPGTTTRTNPPHNDDNPSLPQSLSSHSDPSVLANLVSAARARHNFLSSQLGANAPRILVLGPSGVGKSTLINNMFGVDTAYVRAGGRPLTSTFREHGPFPGTPVRLIDSRGLERSSADPVRQHDAILSYVAAANSLPDVVSDHVHVVWYLPASRWEQSDADIVRRLRPVVPVIIVISKCDSDLRNTIDETRGIAAKLTLRDAIVRQFDDIDIVLCGDPRKRISGWEPRTCLQGHSRACFEYVNNRTRTWRCGYGHPPCTAHGTVSDEAVFGYDSLSRITLSKLPSPSTSTSTSNPESTTSPSSMSDAFVHAQRGSTALKDQAAVNIIRTGVLAMTGIAATPIPFSDMPLLLAAEAYMSVRLFALYNIPLKIADVAFFTAVNVSIIGALGTAAKVVAGFLKASAVALPLGVVVDVVVSATAGTAIGISIAKVASNWSRRQGGRLENGRETANNDREEEEGRVFRQMVMDAVRQLDLGKLLRAVFQLVVFRDQRTISNMIRESFE